MMFTKLSWHGKANYETRSGTNYCTLRRGMVRTALGTVQKDVFFRFHSVSEQRELDEIQRNLRRKGIKLHRIGAKMSRPKWCTSCFVTLEHVNEE